MNEYIEIIALVEGITEKIFITDILAPYLSTKSIYMTPIIISKPGQKGGDVKFVRVKNDIGLHLKQRRKTYLTLFVDFYGIGNDWPGIQEAKQQMQTNSKADKINKAGQAEVNKLFAAFDADKRFIPYVSVHEFEALLFSEPQILADHLQIPRSKIDKILKECKEPENIDDSPNSCPSGRLEKLSKKFKKTTTGIAIAKAIGVKQIRESCPIFNSWLNIIENLKRVY